VLDVFRDLQVRFGFACLLAAATKPCVGRTGSR